MRYVLALLLCAFLFVPAVNAEQARWKWQLDLGAGVTNDNNIEAQANFKARFFHIDLWARDSDFDSATIDGTQARTYCGGTCLIDPFLTWTGGLQWAATVQGMPFKNNGPYLRYTELSALDKTWSLGWKVTIGSKK